MYKKCFDQNNGGFHKMLSVIYAQEFAYTLMSKIFAVRNFREIREI